MRHQNPYRGPGLVPEIYIDVYRNEEDYFYKGGVMILIDPVSCLAAAIYFEARGEIKIGQARVAETVLNRVESNRYPNTICEVVKQKHQFTFYWDGKKEMVYDQEAWLTSWDLANLALCSKINDPTICHYADKDIENKWTVTMSKEIYGNHAFYKGGC